MKIKEISKYVFLFILFLVATLICIPLNLDEIWSYGFSVNIYRGLIPYKDFNMVIPPFYPFLMMLPFILFSSNIVVFHITNALLLCFCAYLLFKLLDKRAWIIIFFFFFPAIFIYPNYNIFLFILVVVLIYLEKYYKNDYLIGFVIGLSILTKHTVGVFLVLPSLYYLKDKKVLLRRFIGCIIPLSIFLIYLIYSKSFYDFINLCVLGLIDFTGNSNGINIIFIIWLLLVLSIVYFIRKDKTNIINYYVLAFSSIVVPLFDLYHLLCFIYAYLIIVILKIKKDYINYTLFASCSIIALLLFNFYNNTLFYDFKYPNEVKYFQYRMINNVGVNNTKVINDFIKKNKDKEIIFLNANAYYFKIINDLDCNYFDLINTGNWGYKGNEKLLREIKKKKDALFLIDENELVNTGQIDKKVLQYVIDNGKKIKNIGVYSLYVWD